MGSRRLSSLPAEDEQLLGEGCRPLDGPLDLEQPSLFGAVPIAPHHEQLDVARDALQVIVEVVGNPAGKGPDGLHFLGVEELRLEISLPGRILNQAKHGGPILPTHGHEPGRGLKNLAPFADEAKGDRIQ